MTTKMEDLSYGDKLVAELVAFIADVSFQREFELFFLKHCRKFDLESEEHSLENTEIFQEFEEMFQVRVEEFCEKEKVSKKEFYDRCREAQTTDVKASHYLNIMLSSVDFPQFVALMRTMRRLHGDRLDRQDRNAEGAVQLDDMLAGSKKKKKKEKKTVGTGDDSKGVESDDEGLDSKDVPTSRADSKDADDNYADGKDEK